MTVQPRSGMVPRPMAPVQRTEDQPGGDPIRVLIADDHALFRRGLEMVLKEEEGIELVGEASDGAEAVAMYEHAGQEIRVVVTDMMMPGMDGPTAIRALRALNPEVRVVATSGLTDPDRGADEVGAQVVLRKPYAAAELLTALRTLLAVACS